MVNPINPLKSFFVSSLLLIALSIFVTLELSAQFVGGQGKGDDRQSDGVALATLGSFTLAELTSATDESTARFTVEVSTNGWESFVRRGVCIGTDIVPGVLDTCFDADSNGADSFEVVVEELTPSTDYIARAFAISSLEITYSDSISFTTSQPPSVSTEGVSLVESRSAVVSGAVTDEGSGAVVQQGVCYGQNENPTTADTCVQAVSLEASFEVELSGLLPETLYYARAYATNQSGTSFGNQVQFTTLPEVIPDGTFILYLTISDTYVNTLTLTAGTKPDATYGFDEGSDVLAPPPPPDGVFDARVLYDGQSYFSFYQPPSNTSNEWLLEFRPQNGFGPVTISWDLEDLPASGDIRLVDTVGGSLVNLNMREQSSLTIEQVALTQLTLRYTNAVEVQASYRNDWDMVGLPVEVAHEEYKELFPAAVLLSLFSYDGSYQQQQVLTPGVGYWLNFSEQNDVTFVGSTVESLDLEMLAGWNLISGLSNTAVIDDPDGILLEGALFGFDGTYAAASQMIPGKGYWAGTRESGTVSIVPAGAMSALAGGEVSGSGMGGDGVPGSRYGMGYDGTNGTGHGTGSSETTSSQHPREDESMLAGTHSIRFSQHERSLPVLVWNATLSDAYHPLQLSLPPRPPQGSVDARLPEGRWIIEENVAQIQLQQNEDPLAFVIEGGAAQYEVIYEKQGQPLRSTMVDAGATETVPQDADALMVYPVGEGDEELGATLPSDFLLEQNYPNPFNPSTTIRYALPATSQVRLDVFTISGQRVAELVSGVQSAGWHEVTFDASFLTSGVYVYRLETVVSGGFAGGAAGGSSAGAQSGAGVQTGATGQFGGTSILTRKLTLIK